MTVSDMTPKPELIRCVKELTDALVLARDYLIVSGHTVPKKHQDQIDRALGLKP